MEFVPGHPKMMSRSYEECKAAALRKFIDKFGHEHCDIAMIRDNAGKDEFVRFRLRDFLVPENRTSQPEKE